MTKITKQTLAIAFTGCIIYMQSCASFDLVPKRYKLAMDCFNYEYTGLDTLINLEGIYFRQEILDHRGVYEMKNGDMVEIGFDTVYSTMTFFKDGVFVSGLGCGRLPPSECFNTTDSTLSHDLVRRGHEIGIYKVHKDIIKTQAISRGGINTWGGREVWFRIIDNSTIAAFYTKPLVISSIDKDKKSYNPRFYESKEFQFYHITTSQSSDNWLKDKKWMQCKFN